MSYTPYGREWYECTRCRHRLPQREWLAVKYRNTTQCPACTRTLLKDFVPRKLPPLDEMPRRR